MLHETGREVKNYGHTVYRALGSHHRLGKKGKGKVLESNRMFVSHADPMVLASQPFSEKS
jgi:hypothetical protein